MEIDFSTELVDFRGEPIVQQDAGGADNAIRLGAMAIEVLLRELPEDTGDSHVEKVARYAIVTEIHKAMEAGEPLDMKTEDATMIIRRLKCLPTVLVGPADAAFRTFGC